MDQLRLRGALGALLVSLAVIGCGGTTATNSPAATVAPPSAAASEAAPSAPAASEAAPSAATSGPSLATSGRIEVADKGFALTLPDGWNRVDLSAGDLDAIIAAAGELDPAVAQQYSAQLQAMLAAGLSIFAFGPEPQSGTTLTVLTLPGAGLSLDLLEQVTKAGLESRADGEITSERVTLPAGEAIHLRYELASTGGTLAPVDQYLLVAGDNQMVVTVTAASEADTDAIVDSIELLD